MMKVLCVQSSLAVRSSSHLVHINYVCMDTGRTTRGASAFVLYVSVHFKRLVIVLVRKEKQKSSHLELSRQGLQLLIFNYGRSICRYISVCSVSYSNTRGIYMEHCTWTNCKRLQVRRQDGIMVWRRSRRVFTLQSCIRNHCIWELPALNQI